MNPEKRTQWAKAIVPTAQFSRNLIIHPTMDSLPEQIPECAREVALVTVFAREQEFAFEPVMESLEKLAAMEDWSGKFLVAGPASQYFNWKKCPVRSYGSFADFYSKELEETWGKWDRLQEIYQQVKDGKLDAEEGKHRVLTRHGTNQHTKGGGDIITSFKERGTSAAYLLARLDRDGFTDLAARVRSREISAHAAAIEAGFRKLPTSLKLLKKEWSRATEDERDEFLEWVKKNESKPSQS